jgi:hypothetical protein
MADTECGTKRSRRHVRRGHSETENRDRAGLDSADQVTAFSGHGAMVAGSGLWARPVALFRFGDSDVEVGGVEGR